MSAIDVFESGSKIITVSDKEKTAIELAEKIAIKVVEQYVIRHTFSASDKFLQEKIEREITEKIVNKFVEENYQTIVGRVSFDTIANLVTIKATKNVAGSL